MNINYARQDKGSTPNRRARLSLEELGSVRGGIPRGKSKCKNCRPPVHSGDCNSAKLLKV